MKSSINSLTLSRTEIHEQVLKIATRRDGKSPYLKVNDKQLQTANLVYIFDDKILSVDACKYGVMTIVELIIQGRQLKRIARGSNHFRMGHIVLA